MSKLSRAAATALRPEIVLAVCAVAAVAPLFCARHLPMSDLPEHVASMATIRHYYDPSWRSADHFVLAGVFDTPYWLYHAVGALLSVVTGSAERANLVLLAAVGLAYPYALRALLVALRRDARFAVFGCALFWTTNLVLGLLNFVAAVPAVLFGAALAIRQAEQPTRRRGIALAVLAVALFYLHLSAFALFVVDAALLTILLPSPSPAERVPSVLVRRLRSLPRRLLYLLPSAGVAAAVAMSGRTVSGGARGPEIVWESRLELARRAPGWLFDVFYTHADEALGAVLVVVLVVLAVAVRARAPRVDVDLRWRSWCAAALAIAATAVFFAMPTRAGRFAFLLDVRMTVFVALFAIPLAAAAVPRARDGLVARGAFAAAAIVCLAMSANVAREVRGFERDDVANFDDLLQAMPHGKRLLMLNFDPRSTHVRPNVTAYFGSYYRARYGGVASFSFSETTHWPTRYRAGEAPPRALAWGNPCVYRNGRDGAYFDYVLVRGERDPFATATSGPRWELVGGSRAWRLFRKVDAGTEAPERDAPGDAPEPGPCS